jgi:hypothetical protein
MYQDLQKMEKEYKELKFEHNRIGNQLKEMEFQIACEYQNRF